MFEPDYQKEDGRSIELKNFKVRIGEVFKGLLTCR